MVAPARADVVVVGGGPAGSAAATHLARAGLHVVLLDKARFPREKACAEYCSPGVVDALDDLGALDLVRGVEHRDLDRMRVVANGRELPLDFAAERPAGNAGLGIKRTELDEQLLGFAAGYGVDVHQGVRVTDTVVENGVVTGVTVRNGAGTTEIRSGFVVAADGLHSTVARSLGLERAVGWPERLGLVARFSGVSGVLDSGQMHIGDGLYSGVTPVGGDEALVSLVVPMGTKPGGAATADFYEASLQRLPEIAGILATAKRVSKVRGIGPLGKRVRSRSGPGYLLVGDAAGFFDPLTGEGIHRALRGGEIAAWAAQTALGRSDRMPVGYEKERSRLFNDKERVCWIIQALTTSPTLLDYTVRRAGTRSTANQTLCGILGDYAPARGALRPGFLWNLFRP